VVFAQAAPLGSRDFANLRRQAFIFYNPEYLAMRTERTLRAESLGERVRRLEASSQNIGCAHQILTETKWLLSDTADFQRIDQRLDALENVLDHPDLESTASEQDRKDGSWGRCYTEWFFKLDATYDYLDRSETRNLKPEVPLRLLDRVNSPKRLASYFATVAQSDIARKGVDNSRELNESMADLMRLILRDRPKGYRWDPRLKQVLMNIVLHRLRNAESGWWGERYLFHEHAVFVDDLSLTFHVVRYLDGRVPELRRIIETTLAAKDLNVPSGWLDDGHFTDHNNMDVAVLFRFGWSAATDVEREEMADELQKMLDWCLSHSLQPDGYFVQGGDDSIEENEYFGVAFLSRIGFFDKRRHFWTTRDFRDASEIRQRITRYILEHRDSGAVGGTYYESALQELNSDSASSNRPD
jgi:hypothetical protein